MNVLAYTRVSTVEQGESGHGLDAQEQKIRESCERRGWTLLEVVTETGSGKDLRREKLQDTLSRLAQGEAEGLVVSKLDRLSRSLVDFAILLDWFRDADATLVALDVDLDTSTPGGRLVGNVFASVAEWERETIAQRTKDALAAMRAQGLSIGPPTISPGALQRIRELRDEQVIDGGVRTIRQIAEQLNREGVPTARGGRWAPSTIHAALGYRRRPPRRRVVELPQPRRKR